MGQENLFLQNYPLMTSVYPLPLQWTGGDKWTFYKFTFYLPSFHIVLKMKWTSEEFIFLSATFFLQQLIWPFPPNTTQRTWSFPLLFWKCGMILKLKSNSSTLAISCKESTHWKRLWCWEGLGAGGDRDDRGWDGWMASLPRWTWVWVNSGS